MSTMLRSLTYRSAANAGLFLGLWFVIGVLVLLSPVPGWLGIAGAFFTAWLLLLFVIMASTGLIWIAAAFNAAFPPRPRGAPPRPRHAATPEAPPHRASPVRAPTRR
jgi:hypothetical protein